MTYAKEISQIFEEKQCYEYIIITKNHGKIPYFLTTSNIIIKHIRNIVLKMVLTTD